MGTAGLSAGQLMRFKEAFGNDVIILSPEEHQKQHPATVNDIIRMREAIPILNTYEPEQIGPVLSGKERRRQRRALQRKNKNS